MHGVQVPLYSPVGVVHGGARCQTISFSLEKGMLHKSTWSVPPETLWNVEGTCQNPGLGELRSGSSCHEEDSGEERASS